MVGRTALRLRETCDVIEWRESRSVAPALENVTKRFREAVANGRSRLTGRVWLPRYVHNLT